MSREWLELESDPGLFTLLVEDFGASGVQVEEIYDLGKPIEEEVYGFIFLFKWSEERRARRKVGDEAGESYEMDPSKIDNLFFAQQIVPNSCATHSLLSVLLNCSKIELGNMLTQFKEFTRYMSPEDKGLSIGSMPELAKAHNRHARPAHSSATLTASGASIPRAQQPTSMGVTGIQTGDAFHFVCYVPALGRLYELDGLKPYPIDHGILEPEKPWTDRFREVITERMKEADQQDVRYNLMAVVPDRCGALAERLAILEKNQNIVRETLERMLTTEGTGSAEDSEGQVCEEPMDVDKDDRQPVMVTRSAKRCASAGSLRSLTPSSSATVSPVVTATQLLPQVDRLKDTTLSVLAQVAVRDPECRLKQPCTTVASTDVTKPLSIETRFSMPLPECDVSPNVPIGQQTGTSRTSKYPTRSSTRRDTLASNSLASTRNVPASPNVGSPKASPGATTTTVHLRGRGFSPSELVELLAVVEENVGMCKHQLVEEQEKRRRYQMDDCRRTFNYDEFIKTYLIMLNKTGQLEKLMKEQLSGRQKRRSDAGPVGKRKVRNAKR